MLAQLACTSSKPLEESHTLISRAADERDAFGLRMKDFSSTLRLLLVDFKGLHHIVPVVFCAVVGEVVDL